jgi:hypothetical protein
LGIYSYDLGERIVMVRKLGNNTLSITRVRASSAYIRSVTDRPPSPQVECDEVQYQCDYLHLVNFFTARVISVLTFPEPLG